MKVQDPKRRRRLADQVARGELTLIKLRDKIEGRRGRARTAEAASDGSTPDTTPALLPVDEEEELAPEPAPTPRRHRPLTEDSLVNAKAFLAEALDELIGVLRTPEAVGQIPDVDRANLAKYLTIAKLRLENAIAIVRTGETGD